MKSYLDPRPLLLTSLLAALALSGCAGNMTYPDSPVDMPQNSLGELYGNVFGGHAPLVGAHLYVIQPGIGSIYGTQASSLLSATYAGSYATAVNSGSTDGDVPNSWYYVTTDATGAFGITGDYSCTVGVPVFLYAYGGTPTLPGTGTVAAPKFAVSGINASAGTGAGNKTITWTTTTPNLFYIGEQITGSGFAELALDTTQYVTSTPTATTFTTNTTTIIGDGNHAYTGTITGGPQPNKDVVNMATLGVCPASGNFSTGATAIRYVYMNEVSTVATAYAFQGFTSAAFNDAFHIGATSSAQALIGLRNATATAANLYDIQGSNTSTTYQGEGHIARYVTAAGNGIVPTRALNGLGNILAACVDSDATNAHTISAQCKVLLANATSDGTVNGNVPPDTATAAFYIARYPAGSGNTSFVSNLYGLPTATVPFSPTLTAQPNDFTVAIQYPVSGTAADGSTNVANPYFGRAESITVDSKGNIWGTAQTGAYAFELSPVGQSLCHYSAGYIFGYVALDTSDNPWTGNANSITGMTKLSPAATGTTCVNANYNANTYGQAYTVINDGSGNTYFMAKNSSNSGAFSIYEFPAGATTSSTANTISQPFSSSATIAHGSIDNSTGNLWITNENGPNSTFGKVVASSGAALFTLTTAQNSTSGDGQPEVPAIDSANNAWIPLQNSTGEVLKVNPAGSNVKVITNATSGAKFSSTFGAAIDGNGNVWISNRGAGAPYFSTSAPGYNTIVELLPSGVAISPSTNYTLGGILNDPLNLAIDPSGNLWITNYGGNAITELIGTAAPVVTPISVASHNGSLGTKP